MIIPKTLEIGPVRYDVRVTYTPDSPRVGYITYAMQDLWINRCDGRGGMRTPKAMAGTFWHEVTHGILHDMKHPLRDDEKFVSAFSKRLLQVVYSARGVK